MADFRVRNGFTPEVKRQLIPGAYQSDRAGSILAGGINAAARGADDLRAGLQVRADDAEEAKEREDGFKVQMALLDQENAALIEGEKAKNSAPLGAPGFTQNNVSQVAQANKAMLTTLKAQGLSDRAIKAATLGLGNIEQTVLQKSQAFERTSRSAKFSNDMEAAADKFANLVISNPDEVDGVVERAFATIDAYPNEITAIEREDLRNNLEDYVRQIAGLALTQQDPRRVVDAFKGNNSSNVVKTVLSNSGIGLQDYMIAGILGNLHAESKFNTGAVGDGGTAVGIAQWREGRLDNLKKFASANKADWRSLNVQSQFIVWELKNSHPEALKALLASKDVRGATAAIAKYYEKPKGSQSGDGSGSHNFAGRLAAAQQVLAGGELRGGKSGVEDDPVLAGLGAKERLQMLAKAEARIGQMRADYKAGLNIDVANAYASFEQGNNYRGDEVTRDRFFAAYENPEVAEQGWAEFQRMQDVGAYIGQSKHLPMSEINENLASLKPTNTSSDTYAVEMDTYKKAVAARDSIATAREDYAKYIQDNFPGVRQAFAEGKGGVFPPEAYQRMWAAYDQLEVPDIQRVAFPDDAADNLTEALKSTGPKEQLQTISAMRSNMPEGMFYATLEQLDKEGFPHLAHLSGLLHETGDREHWRISENALRGIKMLEEDKSLAVKKEDFKVDFTEYMHDTNLGLGARASDTLYDLAFGLYLAEDGDPAVVEDSFHEAIRLLVGGTSDDPETGLVDMHNGLALAKTILPVGVNQTQFENWMEYATPEFYAEHGNGIMMTDGRSSTPQVLTPADIAEEGVFIRTGYNTFSIKMALDNKWVYTSAGEPFVIRLTKDNMMPVPLPRERPDTPEERSKKKIQQEATPGWMQDKFGRGHF